MTQNIIYLGNIWEYPAALARLPGVRVAGILYEEEADNEAALRAAKASGAVVARVKSANDTAVALDEIRASVIQRGQAPTASKITPEATPGLTLGIIANFGIILPPSVLEAPTAPARGFINFHPGLLPDQAGREPVRRLWGAGLNQTGLSIHRVTAKVDAGPVLFAQPYTLNRTFSLEQNVRAIFLLGLPYLQRISGS